MTVPATTTPNPHAGKTVPWTPQMLRVGLVQMAMQEDREANLAHALELIDVAGRSGAQVICLPELFLTPYFPVEPSVTKVYHEEITSDLVTALASAAATHNAVLVAGSIYERTAEGRLFNTALVFDNDGRFCGTYRKIHIPHDPSFYERNYFESGDKGFRVFDTAIGKIAVLICYDQWFPEAARAVSLAGADLIFYPTAIGTVESVGEPEGSWQQAWETVQRGHAVANNVVVAAVNRVGREGESTFYGGSFVSDAFGEVLIRGTAEEQVLITDIDLGHSEFARQSWRLRESRCPQCYSAVVRGA